MEEMDTEDTSGTTTGDDAAVAQPYTLMQLFRADLERPLFIACMLQVIQQFSGINAVSIIPRVRYIRRFKLRLKTD